MTGIARTDLRNKLIMAAMLYAAILFAGWYFGNQVSKGFDIEIWPHTEPTINVMVIGGLLLYIILTAIPFVPGIEIGMAIIVAFGVRIVPAVYLSTVIALVLSFSAGRCIPERWLANTLQWFGLHKASHLAQSFIGQNAEQRVQNMLENAPKSWLPVLLRYRLVALGVLFNLPGSALLGGGGGIAMAAGISRIVSFPKFLLCVVVAVSPVPLLLLLSAAMGV
jgi:hypothetical protein